MKIVAAAVFLPDYDTLRPVFLAVKENP